MIERKSCLKHCFEALNNAFEVQFFSGLHFYTLAKTLVACRAIQLGFCKSGNIVNNAFKVFPLLKYSLCRSTASVCDRTEGSVDQTSHRVRSQVHWSHPQSTQGCNHIWAVQQQQTRQILVRHDVWFDLVVLVCLSLIRSSLKLLCREERLCLRLNVVE